MEVNSLWDVGLTAGIGFIAWWLRNQHEENQRILMLLNKTREEMAKEYSTKVETAANINRLLTRLDALDAKMDRILEIRSGN